MVGECGAFTVPGHRKRLEVAQRERKAHHASPLRRLRSAYENLSSPNVPSRDSIIDDDVSGGATPELFKLSAGFSMKCQDIIANMTVGNEEAANGLNLTFDAALASEMCPDVALAVPNVKSPTGLSGGENCPAR